MIKFNAARKIAVPLILLILPAFIFTIQSCRKKRPELANVLFNKTHNKIFEDATPEAFSLVFKEVIAAERSKLKHPNFIANYYEKTNYEPVLVINHAFNNDLATAANYFTHANEHGLNVAMFEPGEITALVNKLNNKNGAITLDEAYHVIAELEVTAANSMINYTNALQYGVINPKYIYQRYFMDTKRPDSTSMLQVFHISNMLNYLDSIQPKDPQYIALQNALKSGYVPTGGSVEETKRILLVNLERLRWKNKPHDQKYVIVNIPDFSLNVIDSGHSVLKMKVCVGQGRNMDYKNSLSAYDDTCKEDKPGEHETPLLNSLIHSVDVNPIWNIPRSIANKEIIVEAAKDRFYLANKGINVYQKGKLVANPENIDWTKITKENLPYEFKQAPGADNSLGKIKFLFDNESSVYLHDTPVKWAFDQRMRAVSHGCVRLGDPQALALNLFGKGDKYDTISEDMDEDNPNPTTIYLPKKTPVYITYVTCWMDENKTLQFRKDVYGLDIVLYDHLLKFIN